MQYHLLCTTLFSFLSTDICTNKHFLITFIFFLHRPVKFFFNLNVLSNMLFNTLQSLKWHMPLFIIINCLNFIPEWFSPYFETTIWSIQTFWVLVLCLSTLYPTLCLHHNLVLSIIFWKIKVDRFQIPFIIHFRGFSVHVEKLVSLMRLYFWIWTLTGIIQVHYLTLEDIFGDITIFIC